MDRVLYNLGYSSFHIRLDRRWHRCQLPGSLGIGSGEPMTQLAKIGRSR